MVAASIRNAISSEGPRAPLIIRVMVDGSTPSACANWAGFKPAASRYSEGSCSAFAIRQKYSQALLPYGSGSLNFVGRNLPDGKLSIRPNKAGGSSIAGNAIRRCWHSVSQLSRFESGDREPRVSELIKIAQRFRVPWQEMIEKGASPYVSVPLISWVSAGRLETADRVEHEGDPIPIAGLPHGDWFASGSGRFNGSHISAGLWSLSPTDATSGSYRTAATLSATAMVARLISVSGPSRCGSNRSQPILRMSPFSRIMSLQSSVAFDAQYWKCKNARRRHCFY